MDNPGTASEICKVNSEDTLEIIETYVAGIMHEGRHLLVPHLTLRESVKLLRDPDNKFDSNAVKVETQSGEQIGFIPKELAAQIAYFFGADEQPIAATIIELISDLPGQNFRVRISLSLPTNRNISIPTITPSDLAYRYEESGPNIYLLVNGSEVLFNAVKRNLEQNGMPYFRSGLCFRPGSNGHQYQWYLKMDHASGVTQERIEQFFREHFHVISDLEKARELEEIKLKHQTEMSCVQEQLNQSRQEAKAYEDLAENIDTESRLDKEKLNQKIVALESQAKYLQEQIGLIDDEKRSLIFTNESLVDSLKYSNFDIRADDIPDCVSDAFIDVAAETLTLSQSLKVITTIFPNRVEVLDTAWNSAEDSKAFRYKKRAFELLWKLATEYWNILASGRGDVDARTVFGDAFAARESETVEVNQHARRLRTFTYRGKDIEMMKHLKIGVKYSIAETLRIHFEWDSENRILVIGHCGAHLDQK